MKYKAVWMTKKELGVLHTTAHYNVYVRNEKYVLINKHTDVEEASSQTLPEICAQAAHLEKGYKEFVRDGGDPRIVTIN